MTDERGICVTYYTVLDDNIIDDAYYNVTNKLMADTKVNVVVMFMYVSINGKCNFKKLTNSKKKQAEFLCDILGLMGYVYFLILKLFFIKCTYSFNHVLKIFTNTRVTKRRN